MAPKDSVITLLEALAVTAELTGTELSEAAARAMVADLQAYPAQQVLVALTRCRRELKGRLTIAAVLERLDDGRPGPNEAWAMIPQDEAGSVVWTQEMAEAFGVAAPLLREGQVIAARSAFIEYYDRAIAQARAEIRPPRWFPSLGHDPKQRAVAIEHAVVKGRLTAERANQLLPTREQNVVALPASAERMPEDLRKRLADFSFKVVK